MKALTILQPFAWLIVHGRKDIENRTWVTNHRGPLLIHAGVKLYPTPLAEIEHHYGITIPRDALLFGGVIGKVDVVDCVRQSSSKWFNGPYGFVLANPVALPFTRMRGHQGLFDAPAQ
jgi:hypothetical protein